uniref:hypothetical protein n=1 Tax=Algoriphagus sp. TaxID=1872435 RepID=UPI004048A90E
MKRIILLVAFLGTTTLFAQTQNENLFVNDITAMQKNIEKQNKEIENLKMKLGTQSSQLQRLLQQTEKLKLQRDSLSKQIEANIRNISSIAEDLGAKIQTTETNTKQSVLKLDKDVEKNRLYWIIGTLITLILGGLVYWMLGKRILISQLDVENQIKNTKKSLEEESLKLDVQLLDIINSQLKIKEAENDKAESGEKDHSLVLKVADEVTRILMNLEVMDKEIKGYKQLKKYSESILDNLKAYGYDIPQLIGLNYTAGMNMVATLEFDETIQSGKQVIKRIIKPQVNFEGKMIQAAKVIVAFNE